MRSEIRCATGNDTKLEDRLCSTKCRSPEIPERKSDIVHICKKAALTVVEGH